MNKAGSGLIAYKWLDFADDLGTFRFVDAPPDVVDEALAAIDPDFRQMRANEQPPAQWLLDQAVRHEGVLGGHCNNLGQIRVDAICVPAAVVRQVAQDLEASFPARGEWPPAIDLTLAEGWTSWEAERSSWEGNGRELLGPLPDLPVFGLSWD